MPTSSPKSAFARNKEQITFRPASVPGVYSMTVRNGRRCWSERHERYAFASVAIDNVAVGTWHYRRWHSQRTRPGTMMLFEPDSLHVTASIEGGGADFDVLFVEPDLVAPWLSEAGYRGTAHLDAPHCADADVCAAFRALNAELASPGIEPRELQERLCSAVHELFDLAGESRGTTSVTDSAATFRKACRLIVEHYRDDPSLPLDTELIAERVGYSYYWFIRTFKRLVGISPYQYFLRVRLESARSQILAGPNRGAKTLTDVALRAGYCDLPHMTREFKRFLGTGPADFSIQTADDWRRNRR